MSGINRLLSRRDKSTRRGKDKDKEKEKEREKDGDVHAGAAIKRGDEGPSLVESILAPVSVDETDDGHSKPHRHRSYKKKDQQDGDAGAKEHTEEKIHRRTASKTHETIRTRLRLEQGVSTFSDADIALVLASQYVTGNCPKRSSLDSGTSKMEEDCAYDFLVLLNDSSAGIVRPYSQDVKMLGAVNRQGVTCYLDTVLFAMFARLGSFEVMLHLLTDARPSLGDSARPGSARPALLLRLWVNLLRSGKLVTVDITQQIQLQLAECGWGEAAKLCQQDASEAFTFITEVLALPLLTLKMDIFHTGREDKDDDHKFINERLLELAIPEDKPEGNEAITLEECLEMFFNNKIEVKRHMDSLDRRNTMTSMRSRGFSTSSSKAQAPHVEVASIHSQGSDAGSPPPPLQRPTNSTRTRTRSIIQEHFIDEKHALQREASGSGSSRKGSLRTRKEVMMPAWQFFSLIPWYTDNQPTTDAQVAAHFSRTRPVLGISLKRYGVTAEGKCFKRHTRVDIPTEIALPHFISDDAMSDDGPAFGNFKLSLQSVVSHQGTSVSSGHYIALVRVPPPDYDSHLDDRWLKLDDLASERVAEVSIDDWLKRESPSPYLLFYQVVPIEESGPAPPPSYAESNASQNSKVGYDAASPPLHNKDIYSCVVGGCSYQSERGYDLNRHYETQHADDVFLCPWREECNRKQTWPFMRKADLERHCKTVHNRELPGDFFQARKETAGLSSRTSVSTSLPSDITGWLSRDGASSSVNRQSIETSISSLADESTSKRSSTLQSAYETSFSAPAPQRVPQSVSSNAPKANAEKKSRPSSQISDGVGALLAPPPHSDPVDITSNPMNDTSISRSNSTRKKQNRLSASLSRMSMNLPHRSKSRETTASSHRTGSVGGGGGSQRASIDLERMSYDTQSGRPTLPSRRQSEQQLSPTPTYFHRHPSPFPAPSGSPQRSQPYESTISASTPAAADIDPQATDDRRRRPAQHHEPSNPPPYDLQHERDRGKSLEQQQRRRRPRASKAHSTDNIHDKKSGDKTATSKKSKSRERIRRPKPREPGVIRTHDVAAAGSEKRPERECSLM